MAQCQTTFHCQRPQSPRRGKSLLKSNANTDDEASEESHERNHYQNHDIVLPVGHAKQYAGRALT
jgi:hypothetical protein